MKKINCILLVDDNDADNFYNQYIITEDGICNQIKIALDGVEALEYLEKAANPDFQEDYPKPDIIFLDINMPRINGYEFLREFRKLDESLKSKVIVIMLTTSINPDDKQKALQIKEVKAFLNKPLEITDLHAIVEKYF